MGCILEFNESKTRFEFFTRDYKQKFFVVAHPCVIPNGNSRIGG